MSYGVLARRGDCCLPRFGAAVWHEDRVRAEVGRRKRGSRNALRDNTYQRRDESKNTKGILAPLEKKNT